MNPRPVRRLRERRGPQHSGVPGARDARAGPLHAPTRPPSTAVASQALRASSLVRCSGSRARERTGEQPINGTPPGSRGTSGSASRPRSHRATSRSRPRAAPRVPPGRRRPDPGRDSSPAGVLSRDAIRELSACRSRGELPGKTREASSTSPQDGKRGAPAAAGETSRCAGRTNVPCASSERAKQGAHPAGSRARATDRRDLFRRAFHLKRTRLLFRHPAARRADARRSPCQASFIRRTCPRWPRSSARAAAGSDPAALEPAGRGSRVPAARSCSAFIESPQRDPQG